MPNAKVLSEKQAIVAALAERLNSASAGVFVDYKGITVDEDTKLRTELGWTPKHTDFESGLAQTIEWYTRNRAWWEPAKAATEERYKQRGQ